MLYKKIICPVCGGEFGSGDDVVVCPTCGTPHHRSCWKSIGKCANEERHESGFVWTAPKVVGKDNQDNEKKEHKEETAITCPSCGATSPPNTLVCPNCGQSFGAAGRAFYGAGQGHNVDVNMFMKGVKADPNDNIDGIKISDAAAYVQTRTKRYIPKFIEMSREDKKLGWNWAAFFFAPLWFFYRKIYKAGAFFIGLAIIAALFTSIPLNNAYTELYYKMNDYIEITNETTVEELTASYKEFIENFDSLSESERTELNDAKNDFFLSLALVIGVCFVPNIFAAIFSDYIYKSRIVKEVNSMRKFAKNDKTFLVLAMRRGGVSFLSAAGCFLIFSILNELLTEALKIL